MDGTRARRLGTRLLAVGALVAATTATVMVVSDRPEGATASAGHAEQLAKLASRSEAVTTALSKLSRGSKAAPARKRVRRAVEETDAVLAWLRADPEASSNRLLANALERHRDYLDAVGSVLANPRSPLRHRLDVRAERTRAAWSSVAGSAGLERTVRETATLTAYVKWRRSRL